MNAVISFGLCVLSFIIGLGVYARYINDELAKLVAEEIKLHNLIIQLLRKGAEDGTDISDDDVGD